MKYIIQMIILSFLLVNNANALTMAELPDGNHYPAWSKDDMRLICAGFTAANSYEDALSAIESNNLEIPTLMAWSSISMSLMRSGIGALTPKRGDKISECIMELQDLALRVYKQNS